MSKIILPPGYKNPDSAERAGWQKGTTFLKKNGVRNVAILSYIYGSMCVHKPIGRTDQCWVISNIHTGVMLDFNGISFASLEAAQEALERIYPSSNDWDDVFTSGREPPFALVSKVKEVFLKMLDEGRCSKYAFVRNEKTGAVEDKFDTQHVNFLKGIR